MPISATWNWIDKDPLHAMIKRHNPRKLRPVMVFLDGSGKEVARLTGGLRTTEDALLLDRYVAEKHYLKGGDFAAFKKAQKG
jgi:thioredoxin-related protein